MAREADYRRSRLCLHRDHDELLQEMVIVLLRDSYIAPHRQSSRSKSYSIIEGEMVVAFFDASGRIIERVEMGPLGTGKQVVLRFPADPWHTVVARTPHVVYTETIPGPYKPENTDWAPWAPRQDEQIRIDEILAAILG